MRMHFFLLGLVCVIPLRLAAQPAPCSAPVQGADGWAVVSPADVGMAGNTLCALTPRFESWKDADVHGIVVVRHDKLVFEHYFTGTDEQWGRPVGRIRFTADTPHDLRSITKSITSLLLGIAIDRGWVAGVDQKVFDLFPEYADLRTPEKATITLRDLLTMSAGFAWDESMPYSDPSNSENLMDAASDPYRYVLSRPMATKPGTIYNYSSGSAALIAALLRKATGKPLDQLANELLFQPLGITNVQWERFANNDPIAASGIRLRPRDIAKIGQLVLNRGLWDGKQIVPAAWVTDSITPHINGMLLFFYGYQWWLGRTLVAGKQIDWAAGVGYGGQRLFIIPSLDMVVVVTAGLYQEPDMQGWVPLQILNRYALMAVTQP